MNNIPAFPANHFDLGAKEHGMTLRDYFAAKAMQGIAARGVSNRGDVLKIIAEDSYRMADAMLKARE